MENTLSSTAKTQPTVTDSVTTTTTPRLSSPREDMAKLTHRVINGQMHSILKQEDQEGAWNAYCASRMGPGKFSGPDAMGYYTWTRLLSGTVESTT